MNEIIEFFENITIFHVCSLFDIIRCLLIIAVFFIARGPLTYIVVKLLNLKEKDKEKIKILSTFISKLFLAEVLKQMAIWKTLNRGIILQLLSLTNFGRTILGPTI